MKERVVIPEILDELPAEDPRAKRSRRDLQLINSLMGNYRWISRRVWEIEVVDPHAWFEIGAGSGWLGECFRMRGFEDISVSGIDFAPRPERWPSSWSWHQGDIFEVFEALGEGRLSNGLVANLFLHHFKTPELQKIGKIAESRFSRIIVSEPARYPFFHFFSYAFFPFVNDVTRHDMQVSIRAGFRRGELKAALGLGRDWKHRESVTLFGAYRFEAWKE